MMRIRNVAVVCATAFILTSCGQNKLEEFNDSPVEGNLDTPAMRISFPDGFGNVAAKCFGHTLLFSSRIGDTAATGRAIATVYGADVCADGILNKGEIPGAD